MKQNGTQTDYRNRIKSLEYVDAADLVAHPGNWRDHPAAQAEAMRGVLAEVGIAGALLAYRSERQGGALVVIDGHLRKDAAPQKWPVLILDVDDTEADFILATHDPLAAMATADAGALDALLSSVQSSEAGVQNMLAQLAARSGLYNADDPNALWEGMPEFENEAQPAYQSIKVNFLAREAVQEFATLVGQPITDKTVWINYPKREHDNLKAYHTEDAT
jgi:hypothetical protein